MIPTDPKSLEALAHHLGKDVEDLLAAIDQLRAAGLVRDVPGGVEMTSAGDAAGINLLDRFSPPGQN